MRRRFLPVPVLTWAVNLTTPGYLDKYAYDRKCVILWLGAVVTPNIKPKRSVMSTSGATAEVRSKRSSTMASTKASEGILLWRGGAHGRASMR